MPRPNFLILMSDEHDPRVSSPYGHPFVATPALQRLADGGALFENAYCSSPLCVPSRASFMTGKHVNRIGVWDNGVPLASDEPTWAHRLNALEYDTALAGKMHFVGCDQQHGFARRLVGEIATRDHVTPPDWDNDLSKIRPAMRTRIEEAGAGDTVYQQYDDEVVAQTLAYLAEPTRRDRPWALCASIITPHLPLIVRQPYFERYFPEHADLPDMPPGHIEQLHPQNQRFRRYFDCADFTAAQIGRARAAYYGLVTFCDERLGKILGALEANGLTESTVVVYVADHGEMHGEHGLWWKCTFYEGSARIPCIVSWPGHIAAGRRFAAATSLLDIVRTVLDLAGDPADDLDGTSLVPLLTGNAPDGEGLAIAEYEGHGAAGPARMIRRGRYKLNYYFNEPPELFDLAEDPNEFTDLAARPELASVRAELTALALRDWNPASIDARVRESQFRRRILRRGQLGSGPPRWSPEDKS